MKSNKIFVLQTAGKGTCCPACVWQTDLHTGTAAVSEPALSLLHTTAAIYLYVSTIFATQLFIIIYGLSLHPPPLPHPPKHGYFLSLLHQT